MHVAQMPAHDSDLASDISAKLVELNRRSLKKKLRILVNRLRVPIADIDGGIGKAIRARDQIVHKGQYGDTADHQTALWSHVCVIRELLTRILLAEIDYEGRYISYLGDSHFAQFSRTDMPN